MVRPRHPGGEMGEDEVVPAVMRDQSVGGGKIDPDLPFLRRHPVLHRRDVERRRRRGIGHVRHRFDSAHLRSS